MVAFARVSLGCSRKCKILLNVVRQLQTEDQFYYPEETNINCSSL